MTGNEEWISDAAGVPEGGDGRAAAEVLEMDADEPILQDALHVVLLPLLVRPQLDLLDVHALLQAEQHVRLLNQPRLLPRLPHLRVVHRGKILALEGGTRLRPFLAPGTLALFRVDLRTLRTLLLLELQQVEGQPPFDAVLAGGLPACHHSFPKGCARGVLGGGLRSVDRAGLERAVLAEAGA